MSIHKRSHGAKNGKAKKSKKWYIYLRDHNGQIRDNIPAFTDKAASLELDRRLQRLVSLRVAGSGPDAELARFLEGCEQSLVEKLAEWGIVSGERAAAGKTVTDHIADWRSALSAKGNSANHVKGSVSKASRLAKKCKWRHPSDITTTDFDKWRVDLRDAGTAAMTFNHYLTVAKTFCNWMVREKRMAENPLAHLSRLNAAADRRIERHPYSLDELGMMLAAAESGPIVNRMLGADRALLWETVQGAVAMVVECASRVKRTVTVDATHLFKQAYGCAMKAALYECGELETAGDFLRYIKSRVESLGRDYYMETREKHGAELSQRLGGITQLHLTA